MSRHLSERFVVKRKLESTRFNWRFPLYAATVALIVFLALAIYGDGFAEFPYIFFAAPIVSLILLIAAIFKKQQRLSILGILGGYCLITTLLSLNYRNVREAGRWLFLSENYKAEVLAQAVAPSGNLKHIEWDRRGFAGIGDTVEYVVFDPDDSLAAAAKRQAPGKFSGLPCEVFRVGRLESNWYSVEFYADSAWNRCD